MTECPENAITFARRKRARCASGARDAHPTICKDEEKPLLEESNAKHVERSEERGTSTSSVLTVPKKKLTQMFLDLGQRNFYSTQCSACGFVYTPGKEEERLHAAHHDQVMGRKAIKFKGAPPGSTLVAKDGALGAIYMIQSSKSRKESGVLAEVSEMLERELGMSKGWCRGVDSSMFLYVNSGRELIGCVVLESNPVKAHQASFSACSRSQGDRVVVKKDEKRKRSMCPIRVVWASKFHRRKKIATKLLDCVRGRSVPGQIVPRKDLAFSQPTQDGALLIAGYTASSTFLVYE